jgi:hypothetical protein
MRKQNKSGTEVRSNKAAEDDGEARERGEITLVGAIDAMAHRGAGVGVRTSA